MLLVDIPGTADSPAAPNDPESPDRLWSSVLDWVDEHKDQYDFNPSQFLARGISTGGYYAMRIAHTHADRLLAVVAQGGGSHHMFDPEWIRAQNHMEYPFALAEALAQQFGYTDVQKYAAGNARERLSLLESGILDNGCTWLLLINGMEDSIFLIEDSILPLQHGRMKEVRLIKGRSYRWIAGSHLVFYKHQYQTINHLPAELSIRGSAITNKSIVINARFVSYPAV